MNQQRIGDFLKQLRKEKGLTQEQLAERFCVSPRTISRWETGRNMPDINVLIELADFYDVDIREVIDGKRRTGNKDPEDKGTLKHIAEYALEKEKQTHSNMVYIVLGIAITLLVCTFLFANGTPGLLYGVIPKAICDSIMMLAFGIALCFLVSCLRAYAWQEKPAKESQKTVAATVVSKEVKSGTHRAGRSQMGYSFVVNFLTEDNQSLELFTYEIEFGSLKEGAKGMLTYKGRYFVNFTQSPDS